MNMDDNVFCPLTDEEISCVECMENRDIKENSIPMKFKEKENWQEICKSCKYYDY